MVKFIYGMNTFMHGKADHHHHSMVVDVTKTWSSYGSFGDLGVMKLGRNVV